MRRHSSDPVFDWLAYNAEFDPCRLAAVDLATRRWLTYGRFNERAARASRPATGLCSLTHRSGT